MKSLKKFINKIPKLKVYVERKIPEGKTFKNLIEASSGMTCREKLALEHPDFIDANCLGGCAECPSHYGYLDDPEYCPVKRKNEEESFLDLVELLDDETCRKCWDREVHEKEGFVEYEYELYNENGMLRGTCTIPAKYNPIDIPDEVVRDAIFDTMNIIYTKPLNEEKRK